MNQAQLDTAHKELNLPISDEVSKFYELFKEKITESAFYDKIENKKNIDDEYGYSTKRLSTMGIMLGKGELSEKTTALFFNYDVDLSQRMSGDELAIMLNDILLIAYDYLPYLASILYPNNSKVVLRFRKCLCRMRMTMNDYFRYLITNNRGKEINPSIFQSSFSSEEVNVILHTTQLRKFAINQYEDAISLKRISTQDTDLSPSLKPKEEIKKKP